jgi:predicted ribosome quality control (RQC) complex YloA/Tae2 family protein
VGGDSFDAIADELYGLPVAEFTAVRDREAGAARQAGDRELAADLKKLRRPTAGAWLTNQLVRQRGDEVAALLDLGSALRDAQAQLATDDLRRLSQQAQQVVTALGREARGIARDAGQRVGDAAVRELEETLHAALADPGASDAVRAGRLTSALSYAGFGSVDVTARGRATPRGDRAAPRGDRAQGEAEAAQRAAQAEAEAAERAKAELADARQEASEQHRRMEEARDEQEKLELQVEKLTAELERVRDAARQAAAATRDAERAYRDAERRLARAEAAVDGLGNG